MAGRKGLDKGQGPVLVSRFSFQCGISQVRVKWVIRQAVKQLVEGFQLSRFQRSFGPDKIFPALFQGSGFSLDSTGKPQGQHGQKQTEKDEPG